MAKWDRKIPFYKETGHPMSYAQQGYQEDRVDWVDNYEFEDTLVYTTYSRGRSSALIEMTGANGVRYSMFMSDFDDMMRAKGLDGNKVTGKWTFTKKGSNFGLKMVVDV